jgi:hypothetical protein
MNNPTTDSKYETLNDFIIRRLANNDRIKVISGGSLCAQKNTLLFNLTGVNNPSSPVFEGRTSGINAYLAYPASISISKFQDQSKIGSGIFGGEFSDTSAYLTITGSNTYLTGNTAPSTNTALKIGSTDYRILQIDTNTTTGYSIGQTSSFKIDTCI